jgi:hypothetical protein
MDKHFRVGARAEHVRPGKTRPQKVMIVNLTIEYYVDATILIRDRLCSPCDVDHTKSSHPERYAGSDVVSLIIRTTMSNRTAHPRQIVGRLLRIALPPGVPDDATH